MPYNFEFMLLKDKVTKIIYICLTPNDCVPIAMYKQKAELSNVLQG